MRYVLTMYVAEVQRAERALPDDDQDDMTLWNDDNGDEQQEAPAAPIHKPLAKPDLSFLDFLAPSTIPSPGFDSTETLLSHSGSVPNTPEPNVSLSAPAPQPPILLSAPTPQPVVLLSAPPPQPAVSPSAPPPQPVTTPPPPPAVSLPAAPPRPPSRQPLAAIEAVQLDDIPDLARTAFAAVLDVANEWGSPWVECVTAFLDLERQHAFDLKEYRLPASQRPIQFKQWITAKRASGWIPASVDPITFSTSWLAWWAEIQPPGRVQEGGNILSASADGLLWQKLAKTGPSGIFLVLVGLVWWRRLSGTESIEWTEAVLDVEWALRQVLVVTPSKSATKKWKATPTPANDNAPPPKKRAPIPSRRALGLT